MINKLGKAAITIIVGMIGIEYGTANVAADAFQNFNIEKTTETPVVQNSNAAWLNSSTQYVASKGYTPKKHYIETKANTIYTKKSNSTHINFKTKYFLPLTWRNQTWNNIQAMAFNGKYIYVLVIAGGENGRVIRYDTSIINKYGSHASDLRNMAFNYTHSKKLSETQTKLFKGVKVGPLVKVGHGQAFAYNPQTKSLWVITSWASKDTTTLEELNPSSLAKTKRTFSFKMTTKYTNSTSTMAFKNLTFDQNGNFYSWIGNGIDTKANTALARVFKGHLSTGTQKATVHQFQAIRWAPGPTQQSIGYDSRKGRLVLTTDDSFLSIPVSKLGKQSIKPSDVKYQQYNSHREFESVQFNAGYAYLLVNRGPEILKSNNLAFK